MRYKIYLIFPLKIW